MRDLITSITNNLDDYVERYMKIEFKSDDDLPINKVLEIRSMIIAVRAVIHESNKYITLRFS